MGGGDEGVNPKILPCFDGFNPARGHWRVVAALGEPTAGSCVAAGRLRIVGHPMGVAWLVRIIVLRELGEDAAGLYQSAWTLGGLYVGFISGAMGGDFFRLLPLTMLSAVGSLMSKPRSVC